MKTLFSYTTILKIGLILSILFFNLLVTEAFPIIPKKQRIIIENLIKEGAYNDALNSLRELYPLYPENAELLMLSGICYSHLPAYNDRVIPTFQEALNANPDDNLKIEILYNLANAQMRIKLYQEAITNYNLLKKFIPNTFKEFHQQIDQKIATCTTDLTQSASTPHLSTSTVETKPIATNQNVRDSLQNDTVIQPKINSPITPLTNTILTKNTSDSTAKITGVQNQIDSTQQSLEKSAKFPIIDYIYTIQICALKYPAAKNQFKEKNSIRILKERNVYKYFYSSYSTIEEARIALPAVQIKYPGAYITRYNKENESKLLKFNN